MSNKPLAKVFHAEIQGKRNEKYEYLLNNSIASVQWQQLDYKAPYHFFVPKDFNEEKQYELGFKTTEIFIAYGGSVKTERDKICINIVKDDLVKVVDDFKYLTIEEIREKYVLHEDSRDWSVGRAKNDIIQNYSIEHYVKSIEYRPFDKRCIYYTGNSKGYVGTPGYKINKHILHHNYALNLTKYNRQLSFGYFFISNSLTDIHLLDSAGDSLGIFPLYLYPDAEKDGMYANAERTPNLNMEIVNKIAEGLGLEFVPEKEETANTFAPIDILDYIYAVLHSPTYRETYKEFLKIDFPRVPYPHSLGTGRDLSLQKFWKLVKLGGEIRQIHLLESPIVEDYITEYPEDGTNEVEKIKYVPNVGTGRDLSVQDGKVFINSIQYFDNVPEVAWNFYIGGYQPAQKWLKDRKGRVLNFDDILHYQKIIVALTETDRLMKAVDELIKEEGE